ncbi:hypothetical protein BC936DRAFT_147984, partial [Jimgerdemannia flammicorona]
KGEQIVCVAKYSSFYVRRSVCNISEETAANLYCRPGDIYPDCILYQIVELIYNIVNLNYCIAAFIHNIVGCLLFGSRALQTINGIDEVHYRLTMKRFVELLGWQAGERVHIIFVPFQQLVSGGECHRCCVALPSNE